MAYISTPEVAAIRKQLKDRFPQLKFGVRKQHYSSVVITIKSGTVDFSDLLDEHGYAQTNQYWLHRMGEHQELFEEIYKVIKTAPASIEGGREWFDDSDSMKMVLDSIESPDLKRKSLIAKEWAQRMKPEIIARQYVDAFL